MRSCWRDGEFPGSCAEARVLQYIYIYRYTHSGGYMCAFVRPPECVSVRESVFTRTYSGYQDRIGAGLLGYAENFPAGRRSK